MICLGNIGTARFCLTMRAGVGVLLKFDEMTLKGYYGHFARMLIDVDLAKSLPDSLMLEVREDCLFTSLDYENLPVFCSFYAIDPRGLGLLSCPETRPQEEGQ